MMGGDAVPAEVMSLPPGHEALFLKVVEALDGSGNGEAAIEMSPAEARAGLALASAGMLKYRKETAQKTETGVLACWSLGEAGRSLAGRRGMLRETPPAEVEADLRSWARSNGWDEHGRCPTVRQDGKTFRMLFLKDGYRVQVRKRRKWTTLLARYYRDLRTVRKRPVPDIPPHMPTAPAREPIATVPVPAGPTQTVRILVRLWQDGGAPREPPGG